MQSGPNGKVAIVDIVAIIEDIAESVDVDSIISIVARRAQPPAAVASIIAACT